MSNLFTAVSVEQQEIVAGGGLGYFQSLSQYFNRIEFGQYTVAGEYGASTGLFFSKQTGSLAKQSGLFQD